MWVLVPNSETFETALCTNPEHSVMPRLWNKVYVCFASISLQRHFNRESTPKRLGNWEVPRWAPSRARPPEMRPNPKPIADINGRFLPGAPRGTSRCFGHFVGTWDLPRRITREVAAELSRQPPEGRFNDWLHPRVQRPEASAVARMRKNKQRKVPQRDIPTREKFEETPTAKEDEEVNAIEKDNEADECKVENDKKEDLFDWDKKKPIDADGNGPYVPGSGTDVDKRHDSYRLLEKEAIEEIHGPQEDETYKFWRKVAENARKDAKQDDGSEEMKKDKRLNGVTKLPAVNATQNFQFARKMHVGNLEHQPLPDTMGYRKLTKIGEHRESDIVVKPYAIGWKGYGASGPTCCTKMRVHRPKTCDVKKSDHENGDGNQRPSTSVPDLGGKYKKPMSNMDLAICWDFRPDDPKHEPRPTKHIDGSNGSKAPAVFTMVHTPKEVTDEPIKSGHSNPIFNQNRVIEDVGHHAVPYFEKDMTKEKRKDSCDVQYCPQHTDNNRNGKVSKSGSGTRRTSIESAPKPECDGIHGCGTPKDNNHKSSRPDKLEQIKDAWNNVTKEINTDDAKSKYDFNRNRPSLESYDKTSLAQGKLHQSSPNDSQLSRRSTKDTILSNNNNNVKHKNCLSCHGNKAQIESKSKEDYKFAFKAGNPNSVQNSNSSQDSKAVKMPKMRHPYAKKSYSIPTLAPPFSIWRDANSTGYPEHWRLASVYQHAYKPPEQRRKPLIASIYQ